MSAAPDTPRDGERELAFADASKNSFRLDRDVAALQNFKSKGHDAWNYWHGGISYARKTAQAELTALREAGRK